MGRNGDRLLEISGLKTYFFLSGKTVRALDGVDLRLRAGESFGLVGETGSGKTVTALSVLRLIPQPPGQIVAGSIRFQGEDLLAKDPDAMRRIRGGRISMIFQEPMTSLNPVFRIGEQMAEIIRLHQGVSRRQALERAVATLGLVQMPDPVKVTRQYPHELSGGMRQRVMIAMALSCRPALLIADEPTTALDVTIQAQILRLIRELKERSGAAVFLITHDLGVVAQICDRVGVMYAGEIVEEAPVERLFAQPLHPYTRALWGAIPRLDRNVPTLQVIPGSVPDLSAPPAGCKFHPRCAFAADRCRVERPPAYPVDPEHRVACFLYDPVAPISRG